MPSASLRIPSYRRHKPTGQAVVTLGARDIYLGKYNSAASRAEYNRLIAEWTAHDGTLPLAADITVSEVAAAYFRHAQRYYRGPDGRQTNEVANVKPMLRRLKALYGRTRAAEFGPLALKAVRQSMIEERLARRTINHTIHRVRRVFRWAAENELIPPSVLHGLQAVAGLRYGRSEAVEYDPVRPVPQEFVDAVLAHVSPPVAAMIELQVVTGMRSGEVTIMRGCDINMAGKVWVFTPATHKTSWRGHDRKVYLGPKAQKIIRPFLKADLQAYVFSPADAEAQRNERRFGVFSPDRKTRVYPCELRSRQRRREARRGKQSKRPKRNCYDTGSYLRAVTYGIRAANRQRAKQGEPEIPHWHPHQLRHNAATNLRREHGIEVARIILGHRSPAITEVYAEVDHTRAIDVMAKIG